MRKVTLAAGIAAMAMALTAPFALAQMAPNSDAPSSATSSRGNASGPGMKYDQAPGQPLGQAEAPGQTRVPGQQAGYGPGMMYDQAQGHPRGQAEASGQTRAPGQQAGYGPGMMSGQGQGGYFASMMGGYGAGWMGGYGGIWVPILLVLLVAGLVVWVVKQKAK